jgi:FkbM family methyltransferase
MITPKDMRSARQCVRLGCRGILQKWQAVIQGSAPVSSTCQIPEIRKIYSQLNLKSNSGFFVEVGAYDGDSFSNTSFLADQGWKGLYVEPIREFFWQLKSRHFLNRVKCECVAIGSSAGISSMLSMGPLSTMSQTACAAYQEIAWARPFKLEAITRSVRVETLEQVLEKNSVPPKVDLLVIDVEGLEEMVIEQFLRSDRRAHVIVVELHDAHPDFLGASDLIESHARVRELILARGFYQVFSDKINSVFAAA